MTSTAIGASAGYMPSTASVTRDVLAEPFAVHTSTTVVNPIRAKWKTLVNFFALPIRQYYHDPPGVAYRSRRSDRHNHRHQWPCPTYTGEVGDDEMVLFRTQPEEHTVSSQQLTLAATNADSQERSDPVEIVRPASREQHDSDDAQSPVLPQTPPNAMASAGIHASADFDSYAEPSPRYEFQDPMAALNIPSPTLATRSVFPLEYRNGAAMVRHSSTPLICTSRSVSSSPSRPAFLHRRSRASSNVALSSSAVSGRKISEPLTSTLVRSQYSYPKRGPTAQQLTFLSSVESLGRFGVTAQTAPVTPVLLDSPAYDHSGLEYGFPAPP